MFGKKGEGLVLTGFFVQTAHLGNRKDQYWPPKLLGIVAIGIDYIAD
jgi:hypothetical protein